MEQYYEEMNKNGRLCPMDFWEEWGYIYVFPHFSVLVCPPKAKLISARASAVHPPSHDIQDHIQD